MSNQVTSDAIIQTIAPLLADEHISTDALSARLRGDANYVAKCITLEPQLSMALLFTLCLPYTFVLWELRLSTSEMINCFDLILFVCQDPQADEATARKRYPTKIILACRDTLGVTITALAKLNINPDLWMTRLAPFHALVCLGMEVKQQALMALLEEQ